MATENNKRGVAKQSQSSNSVEFIKTSSLQSSSTRSEDGSFTMSHSPADKGSRYMKDYTEIESLGKGGFGSVTKVVSNTDHREYAVKIVKLCHPKDHEKNKRLTQEAAVLATLNHCNIVRYHASWIETWFEKPTISEESGSDETQEHQKDNSPSSIDSADADPVPYLFIKMELCTTTLRSEMDSTSHTDEQVACLFSQLLQGLKYIHEKNIIHRDLNPNNIFVDSEGKIKIGDFGLAKLTFNDGGQCLLSLSKDIGTQAYKAPEIYSDKYNNSVDLYSLGIVFFEMCYRMPTKMERDKVLVKLRSSEVLFPDDFQAPSWQTAVLKSLLSHFPEKRLSIDKCLILMSDIYPLQDIDISKLLRHALFDPSSKSYKEVINSCFNQENSSEHILFDTPVSTNSESRTHFSIVRFVENIFRKYGATHKSTPLLTPCSSKSDTASIVQLMTREGLIVNLPHNARVNFARYVILHEITLLTRYDTLQTYEEHCGRSHPRPNYECVFDVVTRGPDILHADAQVLAVLMDVFNNILQEEDSTNLISLNHFDIVKSILLTVGVKEQCLSFALELVGKMGFQDGLKHLEPHQTKKEGINLSKLNFFLSISGSPDNVKNLLLREVDVDCYKTVEVAFQHLQNILNYCDQFMGIRAANVGIRMKWCCNVHFHSGVIFIAARVYEDKRDDIIVADGGRYDDVLSSFRADLAKEKVRNNKKPQYGCGISVYPSKLLQIQQDFWPPELVVLTCQQNCNLEKSVYGLASKLRMMGFNCKVEFYAEPFEIEAYKQDENVLCVVEYLPMDEINITHKFTNLNPTTQTLSIGRFYNSNPPTIKIRQDDVLAMFTVNFDMDFLTDMFSRVQMIV